MRKASKGKHIETQGRTNDLKVGFAASRKDSIINHENAKMRKASKDKSNELLCISRYTDRLPCRQTSSHMGAEFFVWHIMPAYDAAEAVILYVADWNNLPIYVRRIATDRVPTLCRILLFPRHPESEAHVSSS